jgi:glycosyltransferase involved in cell wall biosynthesis
VEACLSVVVPCFNEVSAIDRVLERVLAQPATAEVIVVDDGSTDGTRERLAHVHDPRVRVFLQPFNMGKGAALRRGFGAATAPYVVVQDADLEYDPADFPLLLGPLLDGKADVVFGSRFVTGGPHRVLYYWHSVGNRLLTTMSNVFTNLNLTDMETCYKAFRREVIQSLDLREDRFGFEPEVTAKVARAGYRVYEVGVSYDGRTYAEGKKIGWRDGVRALYCVARYSRPAAGLGARLRAGRRSPSDFDAADAELAEVLHSLTGAVNYADWIGELIEPWLGEKVVEIGAGQGTLTERLARRASVVATDPSPAAVARLAERLGGHDAVTTDVGMLDDVVERHAADTYVLVNVLEHIADDVGALRRLREHLPSHGRVILFVPALDTLYSDFDARIGHHRRYDRPGLRRALAEAGLVPEALHYVNSLGALAWFTVARVLGSEPTRPGPALLYDRAAVPLVRAIERRLVPPVGQSLFCVARPAAVAASDASGPREGLVVLR